MSYNDKDIKKIIKQLHEINRKRIKFTIGYLQSR